LITFHCETCTHVIYTYPQQLVDNVDTYFIWIFILGVPN
jgi:hypothetical protein